MLEGPIVKMNPEEGTADVKIGEDVYEVEVDDLDLVDEPEPAPKRKRRVKKTS